MVLVVAILLCAVLVQLETELQVLNTAAEHEREAIAQNGQRRLEDETADLREMLKRAEGVLQVRALTHVKGLIRFACQDVGTNSRFIGYKKRWGSEALVLPRGRPRSSSSPTFLCLPLDDHPMMDWLSLEPSK